MNDVVSITVLSINSWKDESKKKIEELNHDYQEWFDLRDLGKEKTMLEEEEEQSAEKNLDFGAISSFQFLLRSS